MLNPGTRIYEYRLSLKISQAELARRAGLAQANLSNIEKGKRDLTVTTLIRLASALGIKPSRLIDPSEAEKKGIHLTRAAIEKLAELILRPGLKASQELEDFAALFRAIMPEVNSRLSVKKTNLAWIKLRQKLTPSEIRGVLDRVRDSKQRAHE